MERKILKARLENLRAELAGFPQRPQLVAVSKYSPFSDVALAYELGQRDFGENRVEELLKKSLLAQEAGLSDIRWHFIGQIQSRKIKKLLQISGASMIHSIDSLPHLEKFLANDHLLAHPVGLFFQVNTSAETEKGGIRSPEVLHSMLKLFQSAHCQNLYVCGLMTMGKLRSDDFERDAKKSFQELSVVRNGIDCNLKLSMGMTADYKWALSEGSDFVRIGSLIFK